MSIEIECPGCGKTYRVPDTAAGKKIRCKSCEEIVEVPGPVEEEEEAYEAFESGGESSRPPRSSRKRYRARSSDFGWVSTMAIILMVLAGLSVLAFAGGAIKTVLTGPPAQDLPPPGPEREGYIVGYYAGAVGGGVLSMIYNGLIVFGCYHIYSRGSSGWARAAAIMSCVPCCSPCFVVGIPFGIAALIGVNRMIEAEEFSS